MISSVICCDVVFTITFLTNFCLNGEKILLTITWQNHASYVLDLRCLCGVSHRAELSSDLSEPGLAVCLCGVSHRAELSSDLSEPGLAVCQAKSIGYQQLQGMLETVLLRGP